MTVPRGAVLACVVVILTPVVAHAGGNEDRAFFEARVRPVLAAHCYRCHSAQAKKLKGKLRLDTRDGLRKGGESGPAIVPGDPDRSLLIRAVRHANESVKMPPDTKLPAAVIADLETWVKRGAVDPRDGGASPAAASWEDVFKERRRWWSLQPVRRPVLPAVKDAAWGAQPIDRFILARLDGAGLRPAPAADRRTLIRRLSLVLTGLPPTPDEVEAFVGDASCVAHERLVDRLLASPHFGERWARHWLDVVRFSETCGNEWNYEVHHAWRYRDYLIRAFNNDVPYDRLVREHIAGDLVPPRWNEAERFNEAVIGTAFWRFGEINHDDCVEFRQIGYDLFDNQIDTLGKTFLATTIACARCHDHKLDAISMPDYYALLGVIRSSRLVSHTIDAQAVNAQPRERLKDLKQQVRAELGRIWGEEAKAAGRYLLAAQATIDKRADAAKLAGGLDARRLAQWRKVLEAKLEMDDPAYLWKSLHQPPRRDFRSAFGALARTLSEEAKRRAIGNAARFTPLGDFRHGSFDGWQSSGQGIGNAPAPPGDFAIDCEGARVLTGIYPAGVNTHTLSSKLNGALRSPDIGKHHAFLSFRVFGGKTAAARIVSNNCQLGYVGYQALTKPQWSWVTLKVPADCATLGCYAEVMTKFDNPKFPDQLGTLGGDKHNDRVPWAQAAADPRSSFGITQAVLHDGKDPPLPSLAHLDPLLASHAASAEELARAYAKAIEEYVRLWANDQAGDDAVAWLDWLLQHALLTNDRKAAPRLDALVAQYRDTENTLALPRIVPGIADRTAPYDQPVLARGDFHRPGAVVRRRFLTMFEPDGGDFQHGSGRLELAERIASADNPLTGRVMVNRVWHHLFGAGLVRTVDDFGHLGERPSHPELLDYLAAEFARDGWSIKRLIRRIVLSRTFQMAARAAPSPLPLSPAGERGLVKPLSPAGERGRGEGARLVDPDNRLLHHYPARRLEAEAIRDAILTASGRLDRRLFGLSIDPWREKANADRRLFPGPLDGAGRRSIYIKVNLMEPPKFLGAFDVPGGKVTRGRRDVTNVPAQALALLNDPFVLQQADVWAERVITDAAPSVGDRIDRMFRIALSRPAAAEERSRFERAIAELARVHGVAPDGMLASRAVWRDVAHAFFNLKEFIYIP